MSLSCTGSLSVCNHKQVHLCWKKYSFEYVFHWRKSWLVEYKVCALVCLWRCHSGSHPFQAGRHIISAVPALLDVVWHIRADSFHSGRATVQSLSVSCSLSLRSNGTDRSGRKITPSTGPSFTLSANLRLCLFGAFIQKRVYTHELPGALPAKQNVISQHLFLYYC